MPLPSDIQSFLDRYPALHPHSDFSENWRFYSNARPCVPDDLYIVDIHNRWFGDYQTLEYRHGFIQWLFPIREQGMNYASQPLQPHESQAITADPLVLHRVITSYQLMLDFYGMRLLSSESGLLGRSDSPRMRYQNLTRSSHNYLRITRILKCLSELGLERLNAGFLLHVLNEQSEYNELNTSTLRNSMDRWWANCIRDQDERHWIGAVIQRVRNGGGYVFTRTEYESALQRRTTTGRLSGEDSIIPVSDTSDSN